ncbi:hypothetical protein AB0J38_17415 [Streptomyces sp. NPDC050095]|uniref:hypothetical protein n=1 Tax=unclassified Streptomyces TaxID=2593676 RepID=UPI0034251ED5
MCDQVRSRRRDIQSRRVWAVVQHYRKTTREAVPASDVARQQAAKVHAYLASLSEENGAEETTGEAAARNTSLFDHSRSIHPASDAHDALATLSACMAHHVRRPRSGRQG